MGGKSKAPAAPDYRGAAEQQGADSRWNTEYQTHANRPNTYTPWGSSTWQNNTGADGQPNWTNTVNLSPSERESFEQQQAIKTGRGDIAQGLMGSASTEMSTPDDFWDNLPGVGQTPNVPDFYGGNLGQMGQGFQGSAPGPQTANETLPGYDQMREFAGGPNVQNQGNLSQFGTAATVGDQGQLGEFGQGPAAEQYTPEEIQRNLDYSGEQEVNAGGGYQDRFADEQYARQMSLLGPQQEQDTAAQETRLRNQGLRPGTAAYDRALKDQRNQQGEERGRTAADAIRYGGQEQQAQFGRELAARQQGVEEQNTQGMFANQASQQALNQQLGIGGQRFGEGMQLANLADSQRGQQAGEQQQLYNQEMGNAQLANSQRGQMANEQQQQFNQEMGASQFGDNQRNQQYNELKDIQGMQSGALQADFDRQMQQSQYADQQRQQQVGEQLAYGNQGFNQQMQQSQMQNQMRQSAIAEQMQREGWSLNKINAALSGQQVGMPQMPNFSQATKADPTNYLGAANMQGQYDLAANQQNNAQSNAMWGALGSIGGGAAMASDPALKTNIQELASGGDLPLYKWDWNEEAETELGLSGEQIGYMVPDVEEHYPQHIVDVGDYKGIDYQGLADDLRRAN